MHGRVHSLLDGHRSHVGRSGHLNVPHSATACVLRQQESGRKEDNDGETRL